MMRLWQNGPSICLSQMVHACILYSVFDIILTIDADGSKVVAQTPEGTRVATPNPMRDQNPSTSSSSASSAAKQSYASALKNKASDWHLEFSMDDHVLPLDMTIYGAVHQHEVRKTSGPPVPLNMIWQGVYTVKYKKVAGPRPSPEGRCIII